MSEYRNRTTGEVKTQGAWRSANPNMSLPRVWKQATLDALDLDPVLRSPAATVGAYQTSVRDGVVQDANGNWVENYVARDMFSDYTDEDGVTHTKAEQEAAYQAGLDDKAAEAVRKERDEKLAATDWRVIKAYETGSNIPAEWELYRQSLRDITTQEGFPHTVTWPEEPVA